MLLNYVVLRALWKIDVYLISPLVNKKKSLYYTRYVYRCVNCNYVHPLLNKVLNVMTHEPTCLALC